MTIFSAFISISIILATLTIYRFLSISSKQKHVKKQIQKISRFENPPSPIPIPGDFSFEIAEEFDTDIEDEALDGA